MTNVRKNEIGEKGAQKFKLRFGVKNLENHYFLPPKVVFVKDSSNIWYKTFISVTNMHLVQHWFQ